jgi:photosystem II stability/assembly factor-like uncharacterized protein
MKNLILILIFLFFNNSITAQFKWQWQNPLPQGNSYSDICFLDSINGFIAGSLGTILKTTNGGENWKILGTNFDDYLRKISFVNVDDGWVMSYYSSILYRTTDSGKNWSFLGQITNTSLNDFKMINNLVGFACGSDSRIFKTTDGGITWGQKQTPFYISSLSSIYFVDENVGYCGGLSPYLLKTVNGGETWNAISLPLFALDIYVYSIHFNTSNNGYISGVGDDKGMVLITTNGGNTWTGAFIDSTAILNAFLKNPNTMWVNASGNILHTTDGGMNWSELLNNCFGIFFLDEKKSWSIINANSIVHSNDGLQTNEEQTNSVSHAFFNDIEVIDSNNVFICGHKEILGTTNGGKNWNVLHADSEINFLSITNKHQELWSVGSHGTIVHSTDDGSTWVEEQLVGSYLKDIFYINSSVGFTVGIESFIGKIFRTTDGGKNWDSVKNVPLVDYYEKIKFSNDYVGFVSSNNGIYKSEDTGNTWNLIKPGTFQTLEVYNNCIWTSVVNQIVFSTDCGLTWNNIQVYEIINFIIRSVESIVFINEKFGWICVNDGRIYKTLDGGFSWELEDRLSGLGLNSIKFLTESRGWAVGSFGTILFYGDLITDVKDNLIIEVPKSFRLFQNYPNPFNPTTTIKFLLNEKSKVQIIIYDLLGREIQTSVFDEMSIGEHKYSFNGKNLSSGIYLLTIIAGEKKQTIKMALLK